MRSKVGVRLCRYSGGLGFVLAMKINRAEYALKALRGDFEEIDSMRRPEEAEDALKAAKA
jgi:hypothetical protein